MKFKITKDKNTGRETLIINNPPKHKPIAHGHPGNHWGVVTQTEANRIWTHIENQDLKNTMWSNCIIIEDKYGEEIVIQYIAPGPDRIEQRKEKIRQWLTAWKNQK